ncbi:beta-ketoacyl synthase chain length factor [Lysobacter sp. S4-A87]|uniref:beta-ketoacyl synthase chain length factor n=1 Tax=Lysobacter sp. S4-A87 TaxID=2925843 RepID=UPI001F530C2F|nr:beta-ketoacyl synthase chain length factor [Lysobacter sp. S4-A87]UNK48450.1 beta-ketoacyl synthase chain length factor [Lysobacter sp. S4-A87]
MTPLSAHIEGIGFWTRGLPSWGTAIAYATDDGGGTPVADAPARPSPQLLPANERRRAPDTVAVALEVALAACQDAGRDPATLPSVFASTHGDLGITDYMCATLAGDPQALSPTRFHNSVHNAAAGYWTIGTGAMAPASAISAREASFAQGLLDALAQLACGDEAVLLVAYDGQAAGPLARMAPSEGLLGGALVLSREAAPGRPQLRVQLTARSGGRDARGPLSTLAAANAMAPMLPLFDLLARGHGHVHLVAGPDHDLLVELTPAQGAASEDAPVAGALLEFAHG